MQLVDERDASANAKEKSESEIQKELTKLVVCFSVVDLQTD